MDLPSRTIDDLVYEDKKKNDQRICKSENDK